MWMNVVLLMGGLGLILIGGKGVSEGGGCVGKGFGMWEVVMGLRIVGLGRCGGEVVMRVVW